VSGRTIRRRASVPQYGSSVDSLDFAVCSDWATCLAGPLSFADAQQPFELPFRTIFAEAAGARSPGARGLPLPVTRRPTVRGSAPLSRCCSPSLRNRVVTVLLPTLVWYGLLSFLRYSTRWLRPLSAGRRRRQSGDHGVRSRSTPETSSASVTTVLLRAFPMCRCPGIHAGCSRDMAKVRGADHGERRAFRPWVRWDRARPLTRKIRFRRFAWRVAETRHPPSN
jgi:hypothetical protein